MSFLTNSLPTAEDFQQMGQNFKKDIGYLAGVVFGVIGIAAVAYGLWKIASGIFKGRQMGSSIFQGAIAILVGAALAAGAGKIFSALSNNREAGNLMNGDIKSVLIAPKVMFKALPVSSKFSL